MKRTASMLALALTALLGCGDPPSKLEPNSSANNTTTNNASTNGATNNSTTFGPCDLAPPGCGTCASAVCADDQWTCVPDNNNCTPPNNVTTNNSTCEFSSASDLAGVSIEFTAERCSWTQQELEAGVAIPYRVVIDTTHTVVPDAQNGCDPPGDSGLAPFARIQGNGQSYCLCDIGLCADDPQVVELQTGTYEFEVDWDGRNWTGPSDFGNPKGEPFPPGEYVVEVSAIGEVEAGPEYQVLARLPITVE